MTETTSGQPRTLKTKVTLLVISAAAAIAPFTMKSEGHRNRAYLDIVGKPTICNGHTTGVRLGQVATDEQCAQYLKEDIIVSMNKVLIPNPEMIENINALKAAGDFSFNTGPAPWAKSPMASYFHRRDWTNGCNAFVGYYTAGIFSKRQRGLTCVPSKSKPGKLSCELKGLVLRRLSEKKICLTGAW